MTTAIRLERSHAPATMLEPGQWTVRTATGIPAVSCPLCGQVDELAEHDFPGGCVSPIRSCPAARCPFLEHLELTGWNEGPS